MTTITTEQRSHETTVSTDVAHALEWLKTNHPSPELYYVDYRDSLDEHPDVILDVIRDGYSEKIDEWYNDSYESTAYYIDEYAKELRKDGVDELDDSVLDAMRDWLQEHDDSDVLRDLIRNTSPQLFFLETDTESEGDAGNLAELIRKYGGRNPERIKEITTATREQFYPAPVSFYFLADIKDVRDAVQAGAPYVAITGAWYGNVDRIQGSNWLGDRPIFNLIVPTESFKKNVNLDNAPGTGYGWQKIAGWTASRDDEASVRPCKAKRKKGYTNLEPKYNPALAREKELDAHWRTTGTCTAGDMNYSRHKTLTYRNDFPCGSTCTACGTFFID